MRKEEAPKFEASWQRKVVLYSSTSDRIRTCDLMLRRHGIIEYFIVYNHRWTNLLVPHFNLSFFIFKCFYQLWKVMNDAFQIHITIYFHSRNWCMLYHQFQVIDGNTLNQSSYSKGMSDWMESLTQNLSTLQYLNPCLLLQLQLERILIIGM